MQVLKKEVKRVIQRNALEEFSKFGFEKSSMRRIATNSGFAVGNLYNYFKDKDELFASILEPITIPITDYLKLQESRDFLAPKESWSVEYHMEIASKLVLFIDLNRELLEILVFHSNGSSLENFVDSVIERYTDLSMLFLKKAGSVFPEINSDISRFTVHNLTSFMMTSILEILMHKIPLSKMSSYMSEVMTFMFYGWEAVMECDFESIAKE